MCANAWRKRSSGLKFGKTFVLPEPKRLRQNSITEFYMGHALVPEMRRSRAVWSWKISRENSLFFLCIKISWDCSLKEANLQDEKIIWYAKVAVC